MVGAAEMASERVAATVRLFNVISECVRMVRAQ